MSYIFNFFHNRIGNSIKKNNHLFAESEVVTSIAI